MFVSIQEEQEFWRALKDEFDLDVREISDKERFAWERLYIKLRKTVLRNH